MVCQVFMEPAHLPLQSTVTIFIRRGKFFLLWDFQRWKSARAGRVAPREVNWTPFRAPVGAWLHPDFVPKSPRPVTFLKSGDSKSLKTKPHPDPRSAMAIPCKPPAEHAGQTKEGQSARQGGAFAPTCRKGRRFIPEGKSPSATRRASGAQVSGLRDGGGLFLPPPGA